MREGRWRPMITLDKNQRDYTEEIISSIRHHRKAGPLIEGVFNLPEQMVQWSNSKYPHWAAVAPRVVSTFSSESPNLSIVKHEMARRTWACSVHLIARGALRGHL